MEDNLKKAKEADIIEFLEARGSKFKRQGGTMVCSSPFSSDSSPSFCVYPDNHFKDYSTGRGGDVITLVQELMGINFSDALRYINGNDLPKYEVKKYEKHIKERKPFILDNYIVNNLREKIKIKDYAKSRKIVDHYEHCFYYLYNEVTDEFDRKLAMGFVHINPEGEIIGVKMRNIDNSEKIRFTARGRIGLYTVDVSTLDVPKLFIVEGEANCNSLAEFFKEKDYSAIVISLGGVGTVLAFDKLPQFDGLERFIIIDWDGNEELYKERLEMYKNIKGTPINLKLEKGVDINSLFIDEDYETLSKLLR